MRSAQVGSYDTYGAFFDLGGIVPGQDDLAYRLTGLGRVAGAQTDELDNDRYFIAPALTWKPDEDTSLTILTSVQHDNPSTPSGLPPQYVIDSSAFKLPRDFYVGDKSFDHSSRTLTNLGYEFEKRFNETWTFHQNVRYSNLDWDYQSLGMSTLGLAADGRTLRRNATFQNENLNTFNVDNNLTAEFSTEELEHKVLLVAGAALGGLAAISAVLAFAHRQSLPPEKLLLAGIAISSLSSAVLAVLMAAGDQRAWQILAWIGGSAASVTPGVAIFLAILSMVVMIASMFLVRWLTLLPLGVPLSRSLGVPIAASRVVTLALCGVATGAASVLVGPLSFVGLIAPHIAARAGFVRAKDHLVASFLLGAIIMTGADFGARTTTFPYELPLGLFAAMVGAPHLIWLITRR